MRGRVKAYERGNLTANAIAGAVKAALIRGTELVLLQELLKQHGLSWEPETGEVLQVDAAQIERGPVRPSVHPVQSRRGFFPTEVMTAA